MARKKMKFSTTFEHVKAFKAFKVQDYLTIDGRKYKMPDLGWRPVRRK